MVGPLPLTPCAAVRRHTPGYWRFYWPLTLMGIARLAGRLAQNYALLSRESGVRELAAFTLALSVYAPFLAALVFVPQMSNVLVRGPVSRRDSLRFVLAACIVLTLGPLVLAWTPLGPPALSAVYDLPAGRIRLLTSYLRWFTPLVLLGGTGEYFVGLLVQMKRTGTVTLLRFLDLAVLAGILATGSALGWSAVSTVGLSLLAPRAAHFVLAASLALAWHGQGKRERDRRLPLREVAGFFMPMAGTSLLFVLTRPIIHAFLARLNPGADRALPDTETMIAALGLAFSFTMLFHSALNQFRNLFATFGREDPEGVRRFMVRVTAVVGAAFVMAVATPVARTFLQHLQDAEGETLRMGTQALWGLCLVPVAIAWRNYYHGLAMVHRRTGRMLAGAVMRNVAVAVCAAGLLQTQAYGHVTAAAMLPVGFAAEAATVMWWGRSWNGGSGQGPGLRPPIGRPPQRPEADRPPN
jgi:hypothetical protein